MHPLIKTVLKAYRPLYLHGLRMDGRFRASSADMPLDVPQPASATSRRRMLLVALSGIRHFAPNDRSRS